MLGHHIRHFIRYTDTGIALTCSVLHCFFFQILGRAILVHYEYTTEM